MDQLNPASLDWALTHIRRYGDTDIFPVPFEFEAIAHDWLSVRHNLEKIDLGTYMPGTSGSLLKPEPSRGLSI
jgi:hypothetical protein